MWFRSLLDLRSKWAEVLFIYSTLQSLSSLLLTGVKAIKGGAGDKKNWNWLTVFDNFFFWGILLCKLDISLVPHILYFTPLKQFKLSSESPWNSPLNTISSVFFLEIQIKASASFFFFIKETFRQVHPFSISKRLNLIVLPTFHNILWAIPTNSTILSQSSSYLFHLQSK